MFSTSHFHPMIVHFPIALITVGFIADALSLFVKGEKCLSRTGLYLMVLGAVAAIAAWATGEFLTSHPSQGAIVEVFEKHESAAQLTSIFIILGAAFRIWLVASKKEETNLKWIAMGFYLLAFVAVTITGFMGGTMVYNYMMSL